MSNYTRLHLGERRSIATFLSMGTKTKSIAEKIGRHRSTIYREIKRNKLAEGYLPGKAHELAKKRHPCPLNKIDTDPELNYFVINGLNKGWSPEQISGRLRRFKKGFYVCHESIYRYVYRHKSEGLYKLLARKKPKRCFGMSRKFGQKGQLLNRNISYRPAEINLRKTFGHWEGDTIHFAKEQASTVTTLVERKSRFVFLRKNGCKKSIETMQGIREVSKLSPRKLWHTLTVDCGSEFMEFQWLEREAKLKVYFCDPRSPWQKGSNENTNGRLRRYLPRNFKIDETNQKNLDKIAYLLNHTPENVWGTKRLKKCYHSAGGGLVALDCRIYTWLRTRCWNKFFESFPC